MEGQTLSAAFPSLNMAFPSLPLDAMLEDLNLPLPDEDKETHFYSFPIDDNFFGQYVGQLEAGASHVAPIIGAAGHVADETSEAFVMPAQLQQYQEAGQQQPHLPYMAPQMAFEPGNEPLVAQPPFGHVVTSGLPARPLAKDDANNPLDRPSAGSTASGVWGEHHSGSGEAPHMDAEDDGGVYTGINDSGARGARAKRNARQQQQNKAAQQRYRERRKQRYNDMEAALTAVQDQMKALGDVQNQNIALQGRTAELEAILREKEQEILRLRIALESSSIKAEDEQEDIVSPLELGQNLEKLQEKEKEKEEARIKERIGDTYNALSSFIEQHGLRNADPIGEGVPQETMKKLQELLDQGCSTFQQAMRAGGLKVVELMAKRPDGATRVSCHVMRARWQNVLGVLRLTPDQEEKIMDLRKTELGLLKKVYEQRQALNFQLLEVVGNGTRRGVQESYIVEKAMQMMLPAPDPYGSDDLGNVTSPAERKIQCMATGGYSACAHHSLSLNKVLDALKRNLRQEQHVIMEMNFNTIKKIFSPIQAALLLVEVYPNQCDMLALANCLAASLEDSGSADSGKSGSGHSDTCHGPDSPMC